MPIRWNEIPHAQIGAQIRATQMRNAIARSTDDSLRHILRRRLRELDTEDHRRFIELEGADAVEHLRYTQDAYRKYVDKHDCRPALEAYWVVLRFAVFPTAIAILREKVIDYLKLSHVPGRDLAPLYGVRSSTRHQELTLPPLRPPDLTDDKPATGAELRAIAQIVNEDTLLWFRDIRDGGAVGLPHGGGPFAKDDNLTIRWSWNLCGLPAQMSIPEWATFRENLWHRCKPWSEGLCDLFGAVQEELLLQWQALPPDSRARNMECAEQISKLADVVIPQRSHSVPRYRSPWKRALWQAVVVCGLDAGYQEVANWIAENLPEIQPPPYCVGEDEELSLAVRHNRDVRQQFQKDLSKIKFDVRSPSKKS